MGKLLCFESRPFCSAKGQITEVVWRYVDFYLNVGCASGCHVYFLNIL